MIPATWLADREQMLTTQRMQSEDKYQWAEGEAPVTDAVIAALNELAVTDADLADLVSGRGQYQAGDTRGYVLTQEKQCADYNCWMVREPNGDARYVSEAPR